MKKIILSVGIALLSCFGCLNAAAQQVPKEVNRLLTALPHDLELIEKTPQRYVVAAEYFNRDIYGAFMNKMRVSGEYTRGLGDGRVKWNNARLAFVQGEDQPFPEGERREFMENFTYKPSENILDESFFQGFPNDQLSMFFKNLVWDMAAFEAFAWLYLDSLELNKAFDASQLNGEGNLAGQGSFTNKDIKLTWLGLSKVNGELCALIDYRAMQNPLQVEMENFSMKGRSHYWGKVWVSLSDKQIEQAVMYEDVLMDMKGAGMPATLANTVREITVAKIAE